MPYYESVFIARQDVSATQAGGLADTFAEIITENGGQVTKREYWGLKNLAYRIRKNRKGHYTLFNIDGPWTAVQEMERHMRLHEDVLRYLTIKVEELEEGPSAVMQGRGSRDDRRGRDDRGPRGDRGHDRGPRGDRGEESKPSETSDKVEAGDAKAKDAKAGDAKAKDAKAEDAKAKDAKAEDAKAKDSKAKDATTEEVKPVEAAADSEGDKE